MLRSLLLVLLVGLAACDSSDPVPVERIDGPNALSATVNGEAFMVSPAEIGWGIPEDGFQWGGAYCVPDDYPQSLYFGFTFPTVEPGTYAVTSDNSRGAGPSLRLYDSEGDATAGEYHVRAGETATVEIMGVDRESGYIQGRFSGTFDYVEDGGFQEPRYFPDVLEVEDGAFTISLFQTFERPVRDGPCV